MAGATGGTLFVPPRWAVSTLASVTWIGLWVPYQDQPAQNLFVVLCEGYRGGDVDLSGRSHGRDTLCPSPMGCVDVSISDLGYSFDCGAYQDCPAQKIICCPCRTKLSKDHCHAAGKATPSSTALPIPRSPPSAFPAAWTLGGTLLVPPGWAVQS